MYNALGVIRVNLPSGAHADIIPPSFIDGSRHGAVCPPATSRRRSTAAAGHSPTASSAGMVQVQCAPVTAQTNGPCATAWSIASDPITRVHD